MYLYIVKIVTSGGRSPSDWVVSIQNKQLMIDPHCETGSQDVVVITAASESLITLHEVTALRFLLRQPSPNWKNFNINGITVTCSINYVYNIYNLFSRIYKLITLKIICCRFIEAICWVRQVKVVPVFPQHFCISMP